MTPKSNHLQTCCDALELELKIGFYMHYKHTILNRATNYPQSLTGLMLGCGEDYEELVAEWVLEILVRLGYMKESGENMWTISQP